MQLLRRASKNSTNAPLRCARELLDTVPQVMRIIRAYMRGHRSGLTVPQFRTLCYLTDADGSSLSAAADFIGLSLPAMSRMVEGLVDKGMLKRRPCPDDRRHVRLSVTPSGEAAITESRQLAQEKLAVVVAQLSRDQQRAVVESMQLLREVFTHEMPAASNSEPELEVVGRVRRS
jgi:DNA-binding MarR family transcriptional regulator